MMKIKRFILLILKIKWQLLPPKKREILLYDGDGEDVAPTILKNYTYEIAHTRKEKFCLFILLKLIFKFKVNYSEYIKDYIRYVNPKLRITFNDNYVSFYEQRAYFPNIKFIAVQRGYRSYHNDILDVFEKGKKKYSIDKYFVFNKAIISHLKKYVNAEYIVLGSPRNNLADINNTIKNKKEILYIASFAPQSFITYKKNKEFIKKFYEKEINILNSLIIFCKNKNLNLNILGKWRPEKLKQMEINFFNENLLGKFNFIENDSHRKTYELLDEFELSIGTHSALLFENFGRGNKSFAFNFRHEEYPFTTRRFGYFSNLPSSGPIWYQGTDIKIFLEKINYLLNCDDTEWKGISGKYSDDFCDYNFNNTILKNQIDTLIKKKGQ